MKNILTDLDKAFENRVRLGIMSALVVNDSIDFNALKDLLGVTDGNLASHIKFLEKVKYLKVNKSFLGRKPNTTYRATPLGETQFKKHIQAISKLLE